MPRIEKVAPWVSMSDGFRGRARGPLKVWTKIFSGGFPTHPPPPPKNCMYQVGIFVSRSWHLLLFNLWSMLKLCIFLYISWINSSVYTAYVSMSMESGAQMWTFIFVEAGYHMPAKQRLCRRYMYKTCIIYHHGHSKARRIHPHKLYHQGFWHMHRASG